MSDNFFIDAFQKFHQEAYRLETLMFKISSGLNVAVHHFEKEQQEDNLDDRELLSSISVIRDVTAKDDSSVVKNDLQFKMGRKEFPDHVVALISREATRNLASLMEHFEGFLKDIFCAVLCYDTTIAAQLDITMPTIVISIDSTRKQLKAARIPIAPFKNRPISGTGIRKYLQNKFPTLKKISTKENTFKLNYDALMDALVLIRHDVTHSNSVLGTKTKKVLPIIEIYLGTERQGDLITLHPTEIQVKNVFAKVMEYAFALAKFFSHHYKLKHLHYTYSNKPAIMLREGKFPHF